jgi:hypothetical protein
MRKKVHKIKHVIWTHNNNKNSQTSLTPNFRFSLTRWNCPLRLETLQPSSVSGWLKAAHLTNQRTEEPADKEHMIKVPNDERLWDLNSRFPVPCLSKTVCHLTFPSSTFSSTDRVSSNLLCRNRAFIYTWIDLTLGFGSLFISP